MTSHRLDELVSTAHRIRQAIESVIEGKRDVVRLTLTVLLAEGHLLIEDVPGVGKTMLAKALAAVHRLPGPPHPVHARPAAQRHHRGQRLQPGDAGSSSSSRGRSSPTSWSATRSTGPRPRPSRRCWSAWRSARSPSTASTYELDAPVHGDRHAEPDRDGGHLPPPGGAARPVHRAGRRWATPSPAAELEMLDVHGGASPLDELAAGGRRRRGRRADRGGTRGATSPTRSSSTRSTW